MIPRYVRQVAVWTPGDLQPGDILLYQGTDLLSAIVRWKTWSEVAHCEWYLGDGRAAASRAGEGVGTYPVRLADLWGVLRPAVPLDLAAMRAFHASCVGQAYDWLGLVSVFELGRAGTPDRAFCSEHVARCFSKAKGGPGLFAAHWDCDRTSPGMLLCSPICTLVRKESV